MREIKFRAWNKKHNIMVSWEQMKVDNTVTICFGSVDSVRELMQFTGLLDKNGKEIYEGDIIKEKFDGLTKIEWGENCSCCSKVVGFIFGSGYKDVEVIGNIYENPELLKTNI
jgi:hypothetical protein